jgi:hypothetical protein
VLGFKLPFYKTPTLLLSVGLSARVLWHLCRQRPDVIHVSTPGILCFGAVLYARLLAVPLVMSYHTHIPEYIPRYTWSGLVAPMWSIIRWCTRRADLTLVTSAAMKARARRRAGRGGARPCCARRGAPPGRRGGAGGAARLAEAPGPLASVGRALQRQCEGLGWPPPV